MQKGTRRLGDQVTRGQGDKETVYDESVYDSGERERRRSIRESSPEVYETMLASEDVLRRDWDQPEEDEAWADL